MSSKSVKFLLLGSATLLAVGCSQSQTPQALPEVKTAKGAYFYSSKAELEEALRNQGLAADQVKNWFTKNPETEGVEGVRSEYAYKELNLKTGGEPVIVAVIDSGVDFNHEDLKDKMWVNKGEIPDNNIDDDKNGFVDDIHGWNFLGTVDKNGKPVHVHATTLEVTRELVRMKALKASRESRGETLTKEEEAYLNEVSTVVSTERETAKTDLAKYMGIQAQLKPLYEKLKDDLNLPFDQVTKAGVEALQPKTPDGIIAKEEMLKVMNANGVTTVARLIRLINANSDYIAYYYNEDFDPRKEIIGDDLNNFDDISYGNNDVTGPDAFHGTHVSGIIGASRNNGIGIDGIAEDVRIMAIRAVPNGDEYDKDVANAVRYAANNGARVINMSFGKAYSSVNKSKVDAAFAYAASKGIVIVHSAGNDAKLNTPNNNFPNKYVRATPGLNIANWIEVGASSATKGLDLPAYFSNFGKDSVDIFAPGFLIESTVPNNGYGVASGTSMAGPCVAGVAAVILSQDLSTPGSRVRDLIRQNARTFPGLSVNNPAGDPATVLFSTLSSTGGVADVYQALRKSLLIN